MARREVTHTEPAWRNRGDSTIVARVVLERTSSRSIEEHLWARRVSESHFEICCIPFFEYDLALGDEVQTNQENAQVVLARVVKRSGHSTFRIWFGRSSSYNARSEILQRIRELECLIEWYDNDFIALDADEPTVAQEIFATLQLKSQKNELMFEKSSNNSDNMNVAIHLEPAWYNQANFIAHAELSFQRVNRGTPRGEKYEQLWCKKTAENLYQICCIPFFVYDLALGDIVELYSEGQLQHCLKRIIRKSNHGTIRVWLANSPNEMRSSAIQYINMNKFLIEWSGANLLSIDVIKNQSYLNLLYFLRNYQKLGFLVYEVGCEPL